MSDPLDLDACAREPIHIPGAIQPHGALLALDGEQRIVRAAGPAARLLGLEEPLPGRGLPEEIAALCRGRSFGPTAEHLGAHGGLDLFAHASGSATILELEPAPEQRPSAAEALAETLRLARETAAATDVVAASAAAARAVRRITGYDRIMVYRFLEDGAGEVIAEDLQDGMEPLLNHRYPASDIPAQARALYLRNPIRVIPDVGYAPAPIEGGEEPLDLSGALLRSVSPIHIQYLKNMGVAASASISLVRDGALWGLIACHNETPRPIHHEQREMCLQAALLLTEAIARAAEENGQREILRLAWRREELLPAIAGFDSVAAGLTANLGEMRAAIPSDGLAVLLDDGFVRAGVTPPEDALSELAKWLLRPFAPARFATASLASAFPPAAEWSASGSGLLSCVVSRAPLILIMWFRAEQVETVNWAGNPHKPAEPGAAPGELSPRRSFDLWRETVSGTSRRWRRNEEEAASRLSNALAEMLQRKSLSELNRQLRGAVAEKDELLGEKDLLMREVHHRVQNNLQLVTSMLTLQEREAEDEGARVQLGIARQRILAVSSLHRRLWRADDDMGNVNLEPFFGELVEGLAATWGEGWQGQLALDVAPVRVPSREALILALIVTELLTNAVKHAYAGAAGPLSLTVRERAHGAVAIVVADRGVGSTGAARPGSFGSRLIERLAQQVRAEFEIAPNDPGTRATLTVPRGAH